jgi:hypothetical protein
MLDPWIIDQIRRREEEERHRREEQPTIEPPIYPAHPSERDSYEDGGPAPGEERGVVIIDYGI